MRLNKFIYDQIREFCLKRLEGEVQKANIDVSFWKLANRIKGSRNTDNLPIQRRDGVTLDARGKAKALAECLEDQ